MTPTVETEDIDRLQPATRAVAASEEMYRWLFFSDFVVAPRVHFCHFNAFRMPVLFFAPWEIRPGHFHFRFLSHILLFYCFRQAGRQENANFYPLILGTWGLWICRSLYAFYMGHIKSPWATVMVLIMVYLFCNWGDSGCRNALPYHWSSEHSRTRFLRARKRGAFGASANEANANRQEGK